MISTNDLQRRYTKIYKCLMHYIFDFKVVEALADFEIAVYRIFPDVDEVSRTFSTLKRELKHTELEDEDLDKALNNFDELLSDKDIYYGIKTFREVIQDEDN